VSEFHNAWIIVTLILMHKDYRVI